MPLGVLMGCFVKLRALISPTTGGWRYLPAASFAPLLLVWFGPSDFAKMALLFLGCFFFLVALILDNTLAVQRELIESGLTMGANRRRVVGITFRAAAPAILDSMRNMIAVAWTYLVIAEIIVATDGIGAVMMRAARFPPRRHHDGRHPHHRCARCAYRHHVPPREPGALPLPACQALGGGGMAVFGLGRRAAQAEAGANARLGAPPSAPTGLQDAI